MSITELIVIILNFNEINDQFPTNFEKYKNLIQKK